MSGQEVCAPSDLNGSSSNTVDGDDKALSVRDWLYRFRHLALIGAVSLLQGCVVGSQLAFIKTTWFARSYVDHGVDVNCDDTPKLRACQQGVADMAYWDGMLSGISGVAAVFSALTLGALSDSTGRRVVLVVKYSLGVCVSVSLVAVVFFDVTLWVFLVVDALDKSFDAYGVMFAIIADLTRDSRDQRGPVIGSSIVMCILLACVVLPLSSLLTYKEATAIALVLSVILVILALVVLPETRPSADYPSVGIRTLLGELHGAFSILNRHSFMQRMVAVLTLGGVAFAGKQTILRPYLIAQYGLDKKHMAILLPICAPSVALCFTLGLWTLVPRFGEVTVLQCSFFANSLLTLGIIIATETWQLFVLYGVLTGPGLMFLPLINAIKSNLCSDQEQGKVQGLIAAVRGFAVSFADVAFGALYKWTTHGGEDTEAARSILFVVLGLTLAAASLALTLPRTYPKPPALESGGADEIEMIFGRS